MRDWVIFAGLWILRASLGYVFEDEPYSAPSIFFFDFMKGLFLCLRFFLDRRIYSQPLTQGRCNRTPKSPVAHQESGMCIAAALAREAHAAEQLLGHLCLN